MVPSDLGQERQRTDVRCEANVDFLFHFENSLNLEIGNAFHTDLDSEARVRRGIANITDSDEVDAETNNMAMYSGDDRKGRTFRCPDGFLESKKGLARL